jgi:N utilization substance protein B
MAGQKAREQHRNERREAREAVFLLLYETEYHAGETPEEIFDRAAENRGPYADEAYLRDTYFGVMTHLDQVDALIGKYAKGWRTGRLSRVSRAVLRLGAYELAFSPVVPSPVVINEAVELDKKYDDAKARAFVNGVLNAVKNGLPDGLPDILPGDRTDGSVSSAPVDDPASPTQTAPTEEQPAQDESHG